MTFDWRGVAVTARNGVQGRQVVQCSAVGIENVGKIGLQLGCAGGRHGLPKELPAAPVIKTRLGSEDMFKVCQVNFKSLVKANEPVMRPERCRESSFRMQRPQACEERP